MEKDSYHGSSLARNLLFSYKGKENSIKNVSIQ